MRLHQLEVTAFGPFAGSASVDFDALSEAGLFLLTGATGAGKTSVLDAVCFALYGEVPGDRQSAKRLRSDQAAEGVAPRVTLELSLSGRRFRVVRSPAWERPKKRGTGTTTEQASVKFFERVDDAWTLRSSRLDETGHLVGLLVGMNLTQFCQVALLPQGRFQAFLRARSDERHQLLQQLFRTGRFEQVEKWLRDHRKSLRASSLRHHEVVADLVSRVSEAAGAALPPVWDPHDLTTPAADGELERWSVAHLTSATSASGRCAARVSAADAAEQTSRSALEQGVRLADLQARHASAVAESAALAASADDADAARRALAAARRATAVVPLQTAVREQAVTLAAASSDHERLATTASALTDGPYAEARAAATDAAARARALLPREATLASLRHGVEATGAEVVRLDTARRSVSARLAELPALVTAARESVDVAVEAGRALGEARSSLAVLRERQEASVLADRLFGEVADAQTIHLAAVDEALHLKELWLQVQEQRLHGMAAEIAGALAVGDDCPVCGSVEHPRLAPALPGAPDAAAEREARRAVDDAEVTRQALDGKVRDLQTRLKLAEQQAGTDRHLLPSLIEQASARCSALALEAARAEAATASLGLLEEEQADLTAEQEGLTGSLAAARATLAAQEADAGTIAAELDAALDGTGCASLAELVARHERVVHACTAVLDAATTVRHAADALTAAEARASEAASGAGFADVEAALAAALDHDEQTRIDVQLTERDAALARVEAVLSDPALRAAAHVTVPDVAALTAAHEALEAELAEARAASALAEARSRRLAGLDAELRAALEAWTPVRADLDLATRLAALADGTSPDNRLQMRLSGYVLAWRLSQVVDAANERLGGMSDQRYSLEHTGRRGAGETRGGLSLLVRDDWSGETRDPATLSGGETFVVSLALALGLADVIAHEVGGTDLDTLFVDEGFGSLDADTLDDVMDTLDSLRDGGRVVGVVSHVGEMRDRIPAQLRVTKSRTGSTLAVAR